MASDIPLQFELEYRLLAEVGKKNTKNVRKILNSKEFNLNNYNSYVAFLLACTDEYIPVIKAFIEKRIDVNFTVDHSLTPLMIAVNKKNDKLIKILLDNGAYIDVTTISGSSPLDMADEKTKKFILRHSKNKNYLVKNYDDEIISL